MTGFKPFDPASAGATDDQTNEGKIPKKQGSAFVDSSITEESDRVVFNKKGKFPAGSVGIGEALELSEGLAKLVTVGEVAIETVFPPAE